jgi:hypothetical protein
MSMNWSVEERRNCRRVVLAVSLLGLAALGRAAHAHESVVGPRFELSHEKSWPSGAKAEAE